MNVADHVDRAAGYWPGRPAIVFEGRTITYGEVQAAADKVAAALASVGLKRGERVSLLLPNIPEFPIAYLGILKAGGIAVSLNVMLKAQEVNFILNDCAANILFTTAELVSGLDLASAPSIRRVVICEGPVTSGHHSLAKWLDGSTREWSTTDMDPSDPAVLLYTSGTTGTPKGATLSHSNVVSNTWATVHHAGYRTDDSVLAFLPLFHVFGQNFIMNSTFCAGARLVLHRRFNPDAVIASIRDSGATVFLGVPTIYIALLNAGVTKADLASIRYDFSAAATMPEEISRRWTELHGRRIFEGYGLTECSPFACYNHDFVHRFGSVGTAVENFELRIVDEDGVPVVTGDLGEIVIRGPGVMQGYWNRPEDTATAIRNGWLRSGDIGRMDDQGYVYIVDRLKDMVNASGFKVWPAEVEAVLYRHPAVAEAAVYALPHAEKGEMVAASIVATRGYSPTGTEIIEHCRALLAQYKVPDQVFVVSELPKNPTGKILKRVLRAQGAASGVT